MRHRRRGCSWPIQIFHLIGELDISIPKTTTKLLGTGLTIGLLATSARAAVVPIDTGAPGTMYIGSFPSLTFSDLNGQVFDGSTITVEFEFDRDLRIDFPTGALGKRIRLEIIMFHDASETVFVPDSSSNLIRANGSGGSPDAEATGRDVEGGSGIENSIREIDWFADLTDGTIDDGYTFSGFTLMLKLPNTGDTVTTGRMAFSVGSSNSDPKFTVVPEPASAAMLVIGGFALLRRRHASRTPKGLSC